MNDEQLPDRLRWSVTLELFLGEPPEVSGCVEVASAPAAADVIHSGGTAVLPAGAWDLADEVLWLMDVARPWRAHQLHWARTGKLKLPVPDRRDGAEPAPRIPADECSGTWPDPPDGQKAGPADVLAWESAVLELQGGARYEAVLRMVTHATEAGWNRSDALRRALDETAAVDDAVEAIMAKQLAETLLEYPMRPMYLEDLFVEDGNESGPSSNS